KKLLFTSITVGREINAYKVFETLNARGVQLSVPDLTKNYLFSVIDAEHKLGSVEIEKLEDRWNRITSQLGKLYFSRFIYSEWNSRNSIVSKNSLFKSIKAKVSTPSESFAYLKALEKSSEIYAAL